MRRVKALFIVMLMLAIASSTWLYWYATQPLKMGALPKTFSIAPGTSLNGLTVQLHKLGIVDSPFTFRLLGRILDKSTGLKAGVYQIARPLTPLALFEKIEQGDVTQAGIQFIEGWNMREVRAALRQQESLQHDSEAMSDTDLLTAIGAEEKHLEGLFFPDTYFFTPRSSDIDILRRAYRAQRDKLSTAWKSRAPGLPYQTPYEALIMASIIEKETGDPDERPQIAAVFLNRLKLGMRLQTDPTVIYGLGERYDGNLRKEDLLQDTPYNTYTRSGLPPTPIANPGAAAIHAALHPATTDALYFVSRGNGSHVFSSTLDAHNRAVQRYQR